MCIRDSGKGGAEIEKVKAELKKFTDKKLIVDIKEVKRPDRDAQLVAENIALQLENRISFRRAMKSTMQRTMKAGAKGIKTDVYKRQVQNLEIVRVDTENNLLLVKGAVPGPKKSLVTIKETVKSL